MYCYMFPLNTEFDILSAAHIIKNEDEYPVRKRYKTESGSYLMQYFVDTCREVVYSGKRYEIRAGHLMISGPDNEYMALRPVQQNEALNVLFSSSAHGVLNSADKADTERITVPFVIDSGNNYMIKSLFSDIIIGHSSDVPLSHEKAKCNLKKLMIEIAELYYRMNSKTNVNIDRVISFIEDNTERMLSIDDMAQIACLSRSSFIREFRKHTGKTPNIYQTETKIRTACSIFKIDHNIRIKKVSQMLGYCDEYYFSNVFKSIVGKSPKKYLDEVSER